MKCSICDCILSDQEAVKKDFDGEFMDICDACEDEEFDYDEDFELDEEKS